MKTHETTWLGELARAKKMFDRGESSFYVECILDNAKILHNEEKKESEKRKKRTNAATYSEELDRIHEMRNSGASIEAIGWEMEKLSMKRDADRYAASVKKNNEERAQKAERQKPGKATFEEAGKAIGQLVEKKNAAYGDSFAKSGDVLKILYPNGIKSEQYGDMLGIIRVLDKVFRIATDKDAFGESPWNDICGYALLKANKPEKQNDEN